MSGTSALNHGEYEIPKPPLPSINANLAGFQCMLKISGEVATPASPIPPARESGAIVRKGTTVCIALRGGSCANIFTPGTSDTSNMVIISALFFISLLNSGCANIKQKKRLDIVSSYKMMILPEDDALSPAEVTASARQI